MEELSENRAGVVRTRATDQGSVETRWDDDKMRRRSDVDDGTWENRYCGIT